MEEKEEIWVDVKNFEGLYQVSNLGRIKGLDRITVSKRYGENIRVKGRLINPGINNGGYYIVYLAKNGKDKGLLVHRLYAQHFLPNPNNYPILNHINGVKTDNRLENLEWCTHSHNSKHAFLTGLNPPNRGEKNGTSKLTKEKVVEIRKMRTLGTVWSEITKVMKVSQATAFDACFGNTWKHIDYPCPPHQTHEEFLKKVRKYEK